MKDKMKAKALKVKNHVVAHKWAYAWAGVAVTAMVTQQRNLRAFEGFLKEKDIDPLEFYFPNNYKELQS